MSWQSISKIIKQGTDPGATEIIAIAMSLNVSANYLLGLPEQEPGSLALDEAELLRMCRQIDRSNRRMVLSLAKDMPEQS